MEALILTKLQNMHQVCEFFGCGKTENVNYIIMSLLGPNLSQLRKKQPNKKFSISTVLRLGSQMLTAVHSIHNCGFLHRDLKPSNFAMGIGKDSRICYVIDFGLSRQYITPTGELKQPRSTAGFRGTVRYASVNAHLGQELGRHDDLWSVLYSLIELSNGELPWKHVHDKDDTGKIKLSCDHRKLLTHLPEEFYLFLSHLEQLNYFVKPDYEYLISLFYGVMERLGIGQFDLFDWEQEGPNPCISTTVSTGYSQPIIDDSNQKLSLHDHVHNSTSDKDDIPIIPVSKDLSKKSENVVLASQDYIIPLPLVPKPLGYHCSMARISRYVKCTNPDEVILQLTNNK